jgi:hypothetical protein
MNSATLHSIIYKHDIELNLKRKKILVKFFESIRVTRIEKLTTPIVYVILQTCIQKVLDWILRPYICTPVVFSSLSSGKRLYFILKYATTIYVSLSVVVALISYSTLQQL